MASFFYHLAKTHLIATSQHAATLSDFICLPEHTSLLMDQILSSALFYALSASMFQALAFLVIATSVLPLVVWRMRSNYFRHYCALVAFNIFLLGWGSIGSITWKHFTSEKLSLLDNSLLWFPWVPYGFPAPFGAYEWDVMEGSSDLELFLIWAAIAIPVWLLTFACTHVTMRLATHISRILYRTHDHPLA